MDENMALVTDIFKKTEKEYDTQLLQTKLLWTEFYNWQKLLYNVDICKFTLLSFYVWPWWSSRRTENKACLEYKFIVMLVGDLTGY